MKRILLLTTIVALFLNSCQNNLTFDNIEIKPQFRSIIPLVSFKIEQDKFYDSLNNLPIFFVTDTTRFSLISEPIIRDNLDRIRIFSEVNNQFDRQFIYELVCLDENNIETAKFQSFPVQPNQSDYKRTWDLFITDNPNFLNTEKLVLNLTIMQPTPINPNEEQFFELKSYAEAYLSF